MTTRKKAVATKRPSTALAKRAAPKRTGLRPVRTPQPPGPILPTAPPPPTSTLGEEIAIADFGLVEMKFTEKEEAVLSRPVRFEDMRVKPTGAVYVPHIVYTRWLNEAFGRTGWALRPASKPLLNNNTVVVPYLLMVHGKPVAFALGEQEFFANNKDQSYGDALESTVASGLRRCCKHLGLALELWDKSFNDQYLEEFCVKVWLEGKDRPQWRRKMDTPFWNERPHGKRRTDEADEQRRPPAKDVEPIAHHGKEEDPITGPMRTRLFTIARRRGRTDDELKAYLKMRGYSSSKLIKRKDYETIVAAVEHPGPLPITLTTREPGDEG